MKIGNAKILSFDEQAKTHFELKEYSDLEKLILSFEFIVREKVMMRLASLFGVNEAKLVINQFKSHGAKTELIKMVER